MFSSTYGRVSRIIEFASNIPDCAVHRLRPLPLLFPNDPDILIVIRGRAVVLKVLAEGSQPTDAQLRVADNFQQGRARFVFVRDDPARVMDILAEVAEEQDRIYAYDPRRDLR